MKVSKIKMIIMIILGFCLCAILVVLYQKFCMTCFKLEFFNPDNIREFIQGFGKLAIVVYVALYALNTVILVPPIAVMSLSAGFLFGPLWGVVAIYIGAFLGTTATFYISRNFGGRIAFVQKFSQGKGAKFQWQLEENGFWVLLPIRFLGFPPWELVNWVSGLSRIRYRDYITATLIGIFPATFAQVYLSHSATTFSWKDPKLYLAVVLFLVIIFVPGWFLNARKRKAKS